MSADMQAAVDAIQRARKSVKDWADAAERDRQADADRQAELARKAEPAQQTTAERVAFLRNTRRL